MLRATYVAQIHPLEPLVRVEGGDCYLCGGGGEGGGHVCETNYKLGVLRLCLLCF